MSKCIIVGSVKSNNLKGVNETYIFNGDIEMNKDGKEVYIIDTVDGEISELVENMPMYIQSYINSNKKYVLV